MATNPACKSFISQLSPYIDGELPSDDRTVLERHLAACKDCTMRAADLRAESGLVRVGMEMLADQVDFKDFAQKVMARVTPEKAPLFERMKLSLSEMFTYQRPMLITSMATACAVVLAVGLFFGRGSGAPSGFAGEHMAVETVKVDESAHVAPVVMETDTGDAIVFTVEHEHADSVDVNGKVNGKKDGERDEELGTEPSSTPDASEKAKKPNGGEL